MQEQQFSPAIIEALGYYVYLLVDPDSKDIFYVGKGTGNRVFQHLGEAMLEETNSAKVNRIREIQASGREPHHIIHRHGLTEKEAFEVETALIDLIQVLELSDLTNIVGGHHSRERGAMTVTDTISMYDAPTVEITEPCIMVIINNRYYRGMTDEELYKVSRGTWVIGQRRDKVKYAFAVANGIVRQVYAIKSWHSTPSFYEDSKRKNRWEFDGEIAIEMQHYVGGSVKNYVTIGAQNPIRYVNC